MQAIEVKPDIYWVGYIDWDLRNFHGYTTQRGTTYNAYLIVDEEITLVDTVKSYGFEEMLQRVESVVDPEEIDNLVVNHVEMDHSGNVPLFMEMAPNARIITSPKGKEGLERHYKSSWDFSVVQSGDSLDIGANSLHFVHIPMVHWPDSMVTYLPEHSLLLSSDAFGQHLATPAWERFDDQVGWDILREEAAKYYANIVWPYSDRVAAVLSQVGGLDIDMIAPSHGIIWRSDISRILGAYEKWANYETTEKALLVYDSMWGSTEEIAHSLQEGLEAAEIPVVRRSLEASHRSDIIKDALEAKAILVGSPTLNNEMLPSVSAFLTYLKGLKPRGRLALAFGSYGWSGEGARKVNEMLEATGFELPFEPMNFNYVPDQEELQKAKEVATEMAAMIKGEEPAKKGSSGQEETDLPSYVCTICGYVYDPAKGDPESGVEPGTAFADLPEDWVCPVCGAAKDMFEKQ